MWLKKSFTNLVFIRGCAKVGCQIFFEGVKFYAALEKNQLFKKDLEKKSLQILKSSVNEIFFCRSTPGVNI